MEIILSVLFIIGFILYCNAKEANAYRQVDWGKVNDDRIKNNLSRSQVNQNIMSGKYNKSATTNKNSDDTWEDFKRRHPHGSWN